MDKSLIQNETFEIEALRSPTVITKAEKGTNLSASLKKQDLA